MKRRIKIIVVLWFLLGGNVFSQEKLLPAFIIKPVKITNQADLTGTAGFQNLYLLKYVEDKVQPKALSPFLSQNYYIKSFGFFCRKEFQFEKTTKIPLRFRLGSLEYCNKLENKIHW